MDAHDFAKKWRKLTFRGFNQAEYAKKHESWEDAAKKLTGFLERGINSGLVADTAAGKTIIALLAIIAIEKRTLFLTPQRLLTEQHYDLKGIMDDEYFKSRKIHGHTSKEKRVWNDPSDLIVFATPHVVMEDIKKGLFGIKDFQMIVFDEMHRATGDYPYVALAKLASENKLLAIGLSASPGGSLEKIEAIRKNLYLEKFFRVEVETPRKNEDVVLAEPDDNMRRIESIFRELLLEVAGKISDMGIEMDREGLTHMRIFEEIEKQLKFKDEYQGAYLAAKYRKLYHAYFTTMTEGYGTFLNYLGKLKHTDGSRAARDIAMSKRIAEIAHAAMKNSHPKVEMLFKILTSLKNSGKNALIFFSQKSTARLLAQDLAEKDWRIELLFGGKDKNIKHQKEVLRKMAAREVDFVFTSSVAEEGLSIPEIDTVIQYSMPPTENSLIQRSGRTGRMKIGHVIFINLNHPLDRIFYFVAKAKAKRMRKIIKDGLLEGIRPPIILKKKGQAKNQLSFSFM